MDAHADAKGAVMAQTYILNSGEILGYVTDKMHPYLGNVAFHCNNLPLLEVSMDYMFHGQTFCKDGTVENILLGYGLPSAVADDIANQVRSCLEYYIGRVMGPIDPTHSYTYELSNIGDIRIIDFGVSWNPQPDENTLIAEIRKGVENGDWYPEHLRRLAGV